MGEELGEVAGSDDAVGSACRSEVSGARRSAWSPVREQLSEVAGSDDAVAAQRREQIADARGAADDHIDVEVVDAGFGHGVVRDIGGGEADLDGSGWADEIAHAEGGMLPF